MRIWALLGVMSLLTFGCDDTAGTPDGGGQGGMPGTGGITGDGGGSGGGGVPVPAHPMLNEISPNPGEGADDWFELVIVGEGTVDLSAYS